MSSSVAIVQARAASRCERACNAACENTTKSQASALSDDTILAIARRAGMQAVLDGLIGRERYHSVTGSLSSLQRFVADMYNLMLDGSLRRRAALSALALPVGEGPSSHSD